MSKYLSCNCWPWNVNTNKNNTTCIDRTVILANFPRFGGRNIRCPVTQGVFCTCLKIKYPNCYLNIFIIYEYLFVVYYE